METIYKSREVNGRVVKNIPYLKHSTPCEEGCCENMITIGVGTRLKTSWLLEVYMVENNISEFDFENWNDELNNQWKAYAEIRKERVRKSFNKSVERNGEVLKRLGDE